VMNKIAKIIRDELDGIAAQEFHLPAIHPAELWQESGRWEAMGQNMFRLKDRANRDMCLGMTHEEVFTSIARSEIRSYRQLPQIWYQIQTKFRDEPRPKSGLLRVRQFTMKDSYSFDIDSEGLDVSYQKHYDVYCRIYNRCGLKYRVVEADSGMMGGSQSHEFMVVTDAGEDQIAYCECGYSANLEKASAQVDAIVDAPGPRQPEFVPTPNQKTIEEVSQYLKIHPWQQIKTLVYIAAGRPVLVLLRGDHQLNEAKLQSAVGTEIRPAHAHEIEDALGASAGSLGPVGVSKIRILSDEALRTRANLTSGANRDNYHLSGVTPERDYQAEYFDLRLIESGEPCLRCGRPLTVRKALEVGHIFKLGTKYSESLRASVLNQDGKQVPIVMGSYGIGLERILAAAVESFHDADGICWPLSIAPFPFLITVLNTKDANLVQSAEETYARLRAAGVEVLLDDRDERPGVKFKDADLIGLPYRVNFGSKKYHEGKVEWVERASKRSEDLGINELANRVGAVVREVTPT
jgi:prolyl-tRNA synthetase